MGIIVSTDKYQPFVLVLKTRLPDETVNYA